MLSISRIAKLPIPIPAGVTLSVEGDRVTVKGPKATVSKKLLVDGVTIVENGKEAQITVHRNGMKAASGTAAALLKRLIQGVTEGFTTKLELVGVGYRAQAQGNKLNLTLGFSHPVVYDAPAGITLETPSQTEIVVKGADNDLVGLVAAAIRRYRPPEPYKGKGVRYAGELIKIKETKKK
jgi:large subunit ribosomal protein L6